jgi:hypothetical protein
VLEAGVLVQPLPKDGQAYAEIPEPASVEDAVTWNEPATPGRYQTPPPVTFLAALTKSP